MEKLARELVLKIRHHRGQADYWRRKAVDKMTWKQFQVFNPSGIYRGKSKKIHSYLEWAKEERALQSKAMHRLNMLGELTLVQGFRAEWQPSSPVGSLHLEVSNG